MTDQQKEFLTLAVINQMKYPEISIKLNVNQKVLSIWWNELKLERENLSAIRKIWRKKCVLTSFEDFKFWFGSIERKCHYCGINESVINTLINHKSIKTKRIITRGKSLEIERLSPNFKYDDLTNLVFCCYWCNNAKTDEFSEEEFRPLGQLIGQIWAKRLNSIIGDVKTDDN